MSRRIYETAIQIGAAMAPNFAAAHKAAGGITQKLGADVVRMSATMEKIKGFEALQQQARTSAAGLEAARAKVADLTAQMAGADKPTKEMRDALRAANKEVRDHERNITKQNAALGRSRAALNRAGVDTRRLGDAKARLSRQLATAQRRMSALTAMASTRLVPALRQSARTARRMGIAITAGATAALVKLTGSAAKYGDSAAKMSRRTGMGVAGIQELRYALERTGGSASDADLGITRMGINIADAARNYGPAVRVFEDLGIAADELARRKPEEQVRIIADAMTSLTTDGDRAAAAAAIFGRGAGPKMVVAMAQGSRGLEEMAKRAHEVGAVLEGDATLAAEAHQDAMLDLRSATRGVALTIGSELMPVVTRTALEIVDWVRNNQGEIRAFAISAREWIEGTAIPAFLKIAERLPEIAKVILDVFKDVRDAVTGAIDAVGGLRNAFIILIGLKFAPLLMSLGRVVGVLGRAVGLGKLLAPAVAATKGVAVKGGAAAAKGVGAGAAALGGGALLGAGAAAAGSVALAAYTTTRAVQEGIAVHRANEVNRDIRRAAEEMGEQAGVTRQMLDEWERDPRAAQRWLTERRHEAARRDEAERIAMSAATLDFAPVINIAAGTDATSEVRRAIEHTLPEFARKLRELADQERRVAFG